MKCIKDLHLYDTNLKCVAEDKDLSSETIWNITLIVHDYNDENNSKLIIQPLVDDGIYIGYTGMDAKMISQEDLVRDFKRINEDGSLSDLELIDSRHDSLLKQCIEEIDKIFEEKEGEES